MFHKIFTSSLNKQSQNSRELHLIELSGTAAQAEQLLRDLEESGHEIHDCWTDEESKENERRAEQEAQPWPVGKRHRYRWGRG